MIFRENAFMQFSLVFQGVGGMVLKRIAHFSRGVLKTVTLTMDQTG